MSDKDKKGGKVVNMSEKVRTTPLTMLGATQAQTQEQSQAEYEEFMRGTPNREEVTQFVSSFIQSMLVPNIQRVMEQNNSAVDFTLGVFQNVLIKKGVITEEEMENVIKESIAEIEQVRQEQLKEQQAASEEKLADDATDE